MGVLGLTPFLQKTCPQVIKKLPDRLRGLKGKTVAIDGTLITQRLHFANMPWERRHVLGWYNIIQELRNSGVNAICVFDGRQRNQAKAREAARRKEVQKLNISRGSIEADRLNRLRKLIELVPEYRALPSHERKRIGLTLKDINLSTRGSSGIGLTEVGKKKPTVRELHMEDPPLTHGQATLSDMDPLVSSTDFDTPTSDYFVIPDPSDYDLWEILHSHIGQTFISTSFPLWVEDPLRENTSSYDLPLEPHDPQVLPEEGGSSSVGLDIPVPPQPTEPESSLQLERQNNLKYFISRPDNQANIIHNAHDVQHLSPAERSLQTPPSENHSSITPRPTLSQEESLIFSQHSDASVSELPILPSFPVETQDDLQSKPEDGAPSQPGNQKHQTRDTAEVQYIQPLSDETPHSTLPPDISITQLPSDARERPQSAPPDNLDKPAPQQTDNTLDAQQVSTPIDSSENPKQDTISTLTSLYLEFCDSIPKVTSLTSSDSKSNGQLTALDDPSEIQAEYVMSRQQLQLTAEEGKIWDELVELEKTPSSMTMDVSLASLEEKSHLMSQSYERRANPPTVQTYEESKEIIKALGVPCMEVAGAFEAEALAASLVLNGHADYVVSEDTDVLVFEAPLIRNITSRIEPLTIVSGSEIRNVLELDQAGFIDFALLLGTDFSQRIKNLGPARALKFIREHGSIEQIIDRERKYTPKGSEKEYLEQVVIARDVFRTLPPVPDLALLKSKESNNELVTSILQKYNLHRAAHVPYDYAEALAGNFFEDNPNAF